MGDFGTRHTEAELTAMAERYDNPVKPMSDERLTEIRAEMAVKNGIVIPTIAPGVLINELLAEVDRLREAADDASYLMRQLVIALADLDRASQIGRRMRFNLTDLIRKTQAAEERWQGYVNG